MIIFDLDQDEDIEGNSKVWANWQSKLTKTTCRPCAENHGRIKDIAILKTNPRIGVHHNCKCMYVPMRTKIIGTATDIGNDGADMHLTFYDKLPDYYVTKEEAKRLGWKKKLSKDLPGKMIGGDPYKNDDGKLPQTPNRVWREADINYVTGKRNRQRILYSNDGLMFVTYDHYHTFYEMIA